MSTKMGKPSTTFNWQYLKNAANLVGGEGYSVDASTKAARASYSQNAPGKQTS
jgi:hypothetical protein